MAQGPDKATELINAIMRGGEKAVSDYLHLSGEYWFDLSPEYFLTTYAAMALKKFPKIYVSLEKSVKGTRKAANATRKGKHAKDERIRGRYDIAIYWSNELPRGVVEVKTRVCSNNYTQVGPDFTRICKSLSANQDSSFQFGAFLFYSSVSNTEKDGYDNASQKLRNLLTSLKKTALSVASEHKLRRTMFPGTIHKTDNEDNGGAWCISCFVFHRPGAESTFR